MSSIWYSKTNLTILNKIIISWLILSIRMEWQSNAMNMTLVNSIKSTICIYYKHKQVNSNEFREFEHYYIQINYSIRKYIW